MAAVRNGGNFCAICPRDAMMDPDARGLAVYFDAHPCPYKPLHTS